MPKFLEKRLKREASRKGLRGKRAAQYIYGTMNRLGAMRGNKETARGRAMAKKHKRDMRRGRRSYRT